MEERRGAEGGREEREVRGGKKENGPYSPVSQKLIQQIIHF